MTTWGKQDNGASSSTMPALVVVRHPSEVRDALRVFNAEARTSVARSRLLLAQTGYWVYETESGMFGPAKFVGFAGMDMATYERAIAGDLGGAKFDGHVTKEAIERALKTPFQPDLALAKRLEEWGAALAGAGVFEGVQTAKWQFVTLPARAYWAVVANSDVFQVERAIAEHESSLWTVKRGDIRAGDRVAIWKAKGSDTHRGVVALGEVLTNPAELEEEPHMLPYWRAGKGAGRQRRVRIRYVQPPNAPLWLDVDTTGALARLSVSKATGGGVFRIKPEQWERLVEALGGWPEEGWPEEAVVEAAWEARARARGQGFAVSPAERKAIEEHAMRCAEEHFGKEYETKRTRGGPYDLHCTHRASGAVLYVEVKGTKTAGEEILLTRNEVRFAREHAEHMALFVQSEIVIKRSDDDKAIASAGKTQIWQPWEVNAGVLKPVGYVYTVPAPRES